MILFLFICSNLLNDLNPNIIGMSAARKWTNIKIEKNKVIT